MDNEQKDKSEIECGIANQLQAEGYTVKQVDGILIVPVEHPSQVAEDDPPI